MTFRSKSSLILLKMCWKALLDLVAKQGSLYVTDYYEIILNKTKKF